MQTAFTIGIQLKNGFVIRSVHDGDKPWFAMVDLFGMVSGQTPQDLWPRPTRPPVPLLARVCRSVATDIVKKFKDFGIEGVTSLSVTTQFVDGKFASEFMRLSGFSDELSVTLAKDLIDTLDAAKAERLPAGIEMPPLTPEAELAALKLRLAKVEHELAYQAKRTSALERSFELPLKQLQMRLNMLEEHAQQGRQGETSRELKAHANRLYARSKQLEGEGL